MRYLVVTHQDGTQAGTPVNDSSVINLKTWAPPSGNDEGPMGFPVLAEDQSFSLKGVERVDLFDDAPEGAEIVETAPEMEYLTDAQAAALDHAAVEGEAPPVWEL